MWLLLDSLISRSTYCRIASTLYICSFVSSTKAKVIHSGTQSLDGDNGCLCYNDRILPNLSYASENCSFLVRLDFPFKIRRPKVPTQIMVKDRNAPTTYCHRIMQSSLLLSKQKLNKVATWINTAHIPARRQEHWAQPNTFLKVFYSPLLE